VSEIHTDHMRLASVLRRAIGPGPTDDYIASDAKELILAARRLASGGDEPAIMRRIASVLRSYGIRPLAIRGAIVLPISSGIDFTVPK
jgi:hypothetical protein